MAQSHNLIADVNTVHRGTFDAKSTALALSIDPGDTVVVTTLSGNKAELPGDEPGFTVSPRHRKVLAHVPSGLGRDSVTGPIAVRGAMVGDELVVEIIAMELAQDWGWTRYAARQRRPARGFPARPHYSCRHRSDARPHQRSPWGLELKTIVFGVIGVAPRPEDGPRSLGHPRAFGGNIDNERKSRRGRNAASAGVQPRRTLSVGDGHAAQGDGEVCLTAIETALRGTLRVSLSKNTGLARPWGETRTHWITMSFEEDLDHAAQDAVREMVALIVKCGGLSPADAYSLCSVAADVHVTQLVNVNKGAHVMLAKSLVRRGRA